MLFQAADYHCWQFLPLLHAVFNKSMRLWPSLLFAPQRITLPEVPTDNGPFIPDDTIVHMPPFVLNRDARNFVRPNEFVPERWTTIPGLMLNRTAFLPFPRVHWQSIGYIELINVVRRLVNDFDLVLSRRICSGRALERSKGSLFRRAAHTGGHFRRDRVGRRSTWLYLGSGWQWLVQRACRELCS